MSTEDSSTTSTYEGSTESETERLIPEQNKIEGKEIKEYICEECGKSFKNLQGLNGHITHVHHSKGTTEAGQIGLTDQDRLKQILNEAGIRASSGRELITSIYFSGDDSAERLNKIMKSKAIPLGTRKLVAMAYFGQDLESMGVEEFLLSDEGKKGEAVSPVSPARRQYEDLVYTKMMSKLAGNDDSQSNALYAQLEAEKQKREAEREARVQDQMKSIQEMNNLQIKFLTESFQKQMTDTNQSIVSIANSFKETLKETITKLNERESQRQELEAVKAQANSGERPLVAISKSIDRTIRELPMNIASAVKQIYLPAGLQQQIPQMSAEQQLATAQALRDQQLAEQQPPPPDPYANLSPRERTLMKQKQREQQVTSVV